MFKVWLVLLVLVPVQSMSNELNLALYEFKDVYSRRFTDLQDCGNEFTYRLCSSELRNAENAPFVLHHRRKTEKVAVLFHGLSDSPYYLSAFAEHLYAQGLNVVVALSPGHGLSDPERAKTMLLSYSLSSTWQQHVKDIMELSREFGDTVIIGGFSTGGALAVDYSLQNPSKVDGIMLFSGALSIADSAESLSKIWGVSKLARWLDRNYAPLGQNPYKYESIPNSSGLELMEVISSIREQLKQGKSLAPPLFIAHSEADITTPIEGVQHLLAHSSNQNTVYFIDEEHQVCHANLVLNKLTASKIKVDKDLLDPLDNCAQPKVNPVFDKIADLLSLYIAGF